MLLCFASNSLAQQWVNYPSYWDNYLIRNLTENDHSFPPQAVYDAIQTDDGFIWLACATGLFRYDGISTKSYHAGNTSYGGNTLYEIHQDSEGNLWLPTLGEGIVKFVDGDFIHFGEEHGLPSNLYKSMAITSGDTLWLGSYGAGIQAFNGDSVIASYSTSDGLVHDQIWKMMVDSKNRLWIGTNDGLSIFENGRFTNFTTKNGLPYNVIRGLKEMDNGEVWVGTEREGIVIFEGKEIKEYYGPDSGINDLESLDFNQNPDDGSIWIAHYGNGIDRYDNGEFEQFSTEDGLVSGLVTFIYFTDNGMAVIGTESGVSILHKRKIDAIDTNQGLTENILTNVNQDSNGVIWAGTYGQGFNYFREGQWEAVEYPPELTNGYASGAVADEDGSIWFNTQGTGIVKIQDFKITEHYTVDDGLLTGFVRGITIADDGKLWVGTNEGVNVIENGEITESYTTENGLSNNFILSAITAKDSSIWMSSFGGGLMQFKDGNINVFDTTNGLLTNQVFTVMEDTDGNIWSSGSFGGLSYYDGVDITSFYLEDGLPIESFSALSEDDFGNLWLGSGGSIFRVRFQDITDYENGLIPSIPFYQYGKEDGVPSNNLEIGFTSTVTKTRSGEILFATNDGIAVIPTSKMPTAAPASQPYIDSFLINGEPTSLTANDPIIVKPANNRIELSYSAINFTAPSKTNFRIKLEGIDEDWVPMEKRRTVYYDFLPDDEYTFSVQASNSDGLWFSETASVSFQVLPPFYKTWWFIGGCLILFGAAVAGSVRIRYRIKMNELNHEILLQQKIQSERERISKDLHDNVGSQITNLITGLEISNLHIRKNQKDEAISLLSDLDNDARGAMTELRETIWLLDQDKVLFREFKKHLSGYLERKIYSHDEFDITIKSEVPGYLELEPSQSLHLLRILQESINNCRKYAQAETCSIHFVAEGEQLKVTISDNGIGFDLDKVQTNGYGLSNIRKRVNEMRGTCKIISEPKKGTTLSIKIPITIP